MKRYKPTFKTQVIKEDAEEDKSIKMIKDLIDLDWEKNEDAQHQALAMIKGLVLADTKSADKFLTDLSTYTSKMSIEDYSGKQEEGCKKKPKKKSMKEAEITGHWLVVSLEGGNRKSAVFLSCLTEKLADKFKDYIENVSNVSVFTVDYYGKSTFSNVEAYFKNYDVAGLLFFDGKNPKKLTKTIYNLLS